MRRPILVLMLLGLAAGCVRPPTPIPPPRMAPQLRLDTVADKRAAFAHAYGLFRRGDDDQAGPIFAALAQAYPELADYALYFAGSIAQRRGDTAAAEAAFSGLLRDYPQSAKAHAAALEMGRLLLRRDAAGQARPLLQSALSAPDAATVQGARLALAEADERDGNAAAAYAGYTQVRRRTMGSPLGRAAKQRVLALRTQYPALAPVGADLLDEARLLLGERDYDAADSAAAQLLQRLDGVEPAAVFRVQADALYGRGDVDAGLARLRALVDRYPSSPEAPGALFRLASVRWNRDQDDAALGAFEEFRRRYPNDHRAAETLYAIARIHQSAGRDTLAVGGFAALARRYPRNKLAGDARWRIGWIRYRDRNWPAAVSAFARLADEALSSQQRSGAVYWEARTLEHAGRAGAARDLYRDIVDRDPTDYYAMWAERRLGASLPAAVAAPPAAALPPGTPEGSAALEPASGADAFHFSRWSELKAAGVYTLARQELKAIERGGQDDIDTMRYLLHAYQAVDGFAAAQRLLRRLRDDAGLSALERRRLLYPLAFWSIVDREARDNSIDPLLIEALMRQESLFDPEARSPANAYGLMQLLPRTASRVAAADGRAVDPPALFEPDINIDLGTRYLKGLLARFGGDVLKAVAAYNGGEAAVEKWERRFADLEPDEFVESISYRETRDYVKRVVTNYREYRRLYAGPRS